MSIYKEFLHVTQYEYLNDFRIYRRKGNSTYQNKNIVIISIQYNDTIDYVRSMFESLQCLI